MIEGTNVNQSINSLSINSPDSQLNAVNSGALFRMSLVANQLTSSAKNLDETASAQASSNFSKVTQEELEQAIASEPVFNEYLNSLKADTKMESLTKKQWLKDLTDSINNRAAKMPKGDKGIELTFRFRAAYGAINHIAVGSLLRDSEGKLKFGVAHQESIPFKKNGETIYQGLVFDSFDTKTYFQGKKPPVLQSMEKSGLPDVMIRTCPHPENISMAKWIGDLSCLHPYGFDGKQNDQGFHALTCFSITRAVQKSLQGESAEVDVKATMPYGFKDVITDLFGKKSYENLRQISINGKEYDIENLSKNQLKYGFMDCGKKWGDNENWDVSPVMLKTRF